MASSSCGMESAEGPVSYSKGIQDYDTSNVVFVTHRKWESKANWSQGYLSGGFEHTPDGENVDWQSFAFRAQVARASDSSASLPPSKMVVSLGRDGDGNEVRAIVNRSPGAGLREFAVLELDGKVLITANVHSGIDRSGHHPYYGWRCKSVFYAEHVPGFGSLAPQIAEGTIYVTHRKWESKANWSQGYLSGGFEHTPDGENVDWQSFAFRAQVARASDSSAFLPPSKMVVSLGRDGDGNEVRAIVNRSPGAGLREFAVLELDGKVLITANVHSGIDRSGHHPYYGWRCKSVFYAEHVPGFGSLARAAAASCGVDNEPSRAGAGGAAAVPEEEPPATGGGSGEACSHDGKNCVICLCPITGTKTAFVPCGHVCCCVADARNVMEQATRTCPVCRTPIREAIKVFI